MNATATAIVKGAVWKHVKRTDWQGQPKVYTITSVSQAKNLVYSKDDLGLKLRTPLDTFDAYCAEVVKVPEQAAKAAAPKLTDAQCEALHAKAHAAGMAAGEGSKPAPMVVQQRANPLDDTSPVVKTYAPVMDGVCGFAWVKVRPGTSAYARWAKKVLGAHKGYYGGTEIWVRPFGQSYERKVAYASAYAKVLTEAGITAYADGRLD